MEQAFLEILMDLIYRVDNGANILLGNRALAQEYVGKLMGVDKNENNKTN